MPVGQPIVGHPVRRCTLRSRSSMLCWRTKVAPINGRWSAEPAAGVVASNNAVRELLEDCANGDVETLIVVGSNPLYAFPEFAGDKFDAAKPGALSKVKTVLALNDRVDETAAEADMVCAHHP